MSKTKGTVLKILKEQILQLHQGVAQMNEQSLIKQLAKQKIVYSLSKRENALDLVYSYFALAQFYIMHELYQPAIKSLNQANDIKQTGDAVYLIAVCLYKTNKQIEAYRLFQRCLSLEWIEPSVIHQETNQLEAISYMQKIEYDKINKMPDRKEDIQKKLVQLCYQKINVIKKYHSNQSENYFYGLAMGDLAEIYQQFGEYQVALEKIKTAIKLMKGQRLGIDKLIQFYLSSAKINDNLKQSAQSILDLRNAIELIENGKKSDEGQKFNKNYEDIYYLYIKKSLNV